MKDIRYAILEWGTKVKVLNIQTLEEVFLSRYEVEEYALKDVIFGVSYNNGNLIYNKLSTKSLYIYLRDIHPEALYEVVPEKRYNLVTQDYLSYRRLSWRCRFCNGVWVASPNYRFSQRNRIDCPYCQGNSIPKTDTFAIRCPDLLRDWDFDKNTIDPYKISADSNAFVQWKCHKCGKSWRDRIKTRTLAGDDLGACPRCMRTNIMGGTSQPEIILYKKLLSFYDCTNRGKLDGVEFDILCEDNKFAVEYDGYAFHNDRRAEDLFKNKIAAEHGYTLYRIRESGLPALSDFNCINLRVTDDFSFEDCINKLLRMLTKRDAEYALT